MTTPLELTQQALDVSVTECNTFRTCRRRWHLTTIENLEPKIPTWAFEFGTGIHRALEAMAKGRKPKTIHKTFENWYKEVAERIGDLPAELQDELFDLRNLGHGMLDNYFKFDEVCPIELGTPMAVEGLVLPKFKDVLQPEVPPLGDYPPGARVTRHPSGRLLVPIVDPHTKNVLENGAVLSARIDLLTERATPQKGLWVVDRKTATKAPNDKGLDFDDQLTGYCYTVWRWLGVIPRGAMYDVLIKQEPKAPRIVKKGTELSAAKDQLTTPDMYRAALKEFGLLLPGSGDVATEQHAACLEALLARGWDPFFRRFEALRSEYELFDFEQRLFDEYSDMENALMIEEKRYPNPSTFLCPNCPVGSICRAMMDGSDPDAIIEGQFQEAPDRKAKT